MSEMVDADRERRHLADSDLLDFLSSIEPGVGEPGLPRRAMLKLRNRLLLALYISGSLLAGLIMLGRLGVDALTFVPLFALWIFLGIPTCCRLER